MIHTNAGDDRINLFSWWRTRKDAEDSLSLSLQKVRWMKKKLIEPKDWICLRNRKRIWTETEQTIEQESFSSSIDTIDRREYRYRSHSLGRKEWMKERQEIWRFLQEMCAIYSYHSSETEEPEVTYFFFLSQQKVAISIIIITTAAGKHNAYSFFSLPEMQKTGSPLLAISRYFCVILGRRGKNPFLVA